MSMVNLRRKMGPDTLVFIVSLFTEGFLLFLAVYFVITLSDLECDYLNARTCCDKLNKWIIPEIICHNLLSAMLLLTGHWVLFLMYCSLGIWIAYKYLTKPSGDIGIFDPTEVHNRQKLKTYMRESLIKLGYHLFYFFVYLYWMIYSLLKGT